MTQPKENTSHSALDVSTIHGRANRALISLDSAKGTKINFYRKINTPVDFGAYQDWRNRRQSSPDSVIRPNESNEGQALLGIDTANQSPNTEDAISWQSAERNALSLGPDEPEAAYPNSFSQIVELISSGQSIPGIKDIPTVVLEGQSSQTSKSKRRKPWERQDQAAEHADDKMETIQP